MISPRPIEFSFEKFITNSLNNSFLCKNNGLIFMNNFSFISFFDEFSKAFL